MVADDEVDGARCGDRLGNCPLFGGHVVTSFDTPMHADDYDFGTELAGVRGVGDDPLWLDQR